MFEAQLGAPPRYRFWYLSVYLVFLYDCVICADWRGGSPGHKLDSTVGIMKAYSTCVGEGPFTVEMFGEEADALRQAGGEYGAATGRPRRVRGLRCRRFKIRCPGPGATELAITKIGCAVLHERNPGVREL